MEILFSIFKIIGLIILAGGCLFVGLYAAENTHVGFDRHWLDTWGIATAYGLDCRR